MTVTSNARRELTYVKPQAGYGERKGFWKIECSSCDGSYLLKGMLNAADDWLAQRFRNQGWQVTSKLKKPLCPDCQGGPRKGNTDMSKKAGNSARATVEAFKRISAAFDPEARNYKNGQSDSLIAQDTGLSLEEVAAIREGEFGPMEDPKVAILRKKLDENFSAFTKELGDLVEMIKAVEADYKKRDAQIRIQLEDLGD